MIDITYPEMVFAITAVWILLRAVFAAKKRRVSLKYEAKLLTVYICLIVIARIVYFPWHTENGHIGHLVFDAEKMIPFRTNLIPIVHIFDRYYGWKMNIIGNVCMFIPVGIVWPLCFKRLDKMWKAVSAAAGLSLFIELSQLLFYTRYTDVDDLIMNTSGALIGAAIYFSTARLIQHKKTKSPKAE